MIQYISIQIWIIWHDLNNDIYISYNEYIGVQGEPRIGILYDEFSAFESCDDLPLVRFVGDSIRCNVVLLTWLC